MKLIKYILEILIELVFPTKTFPNLDNVLLSQSEASALCEIYSIFLYKDSKVEQAIWQLKYRGNKKIGRMLALYIYDHMIEVLSERLLFSNFSNPILIPLPLSEKRLEERGYNQSEILAEILANLDQNNSFELDTKILKKIKHTKPQATLKRHERLENLKGCFEIDQNSIEKINGRNIILLDDVTTTGSTINEAVLTLQNAGAHHIMAFTIAH